MQKRVVAISDISCLGKCSLTVALPIISAAGIETAVALKNAYAMAVSLAIGAYTKNDPSLPEKYNAQAGLFL